MRHLFLLVGVFVIGSFPALALTISHNFRERGLSLNIYEAYYLGAKP